MTTTSDTILDLVKAALKPDAAPYPTDAEGRVYRPGDWVTWDQQYPAIKLRLMSEEKTSLGRADIAFTVVSTVRVIAQVAAFASPDDGGAGDAEEALWRLQRQIEVAVINSYPLTSKLQQFPFVRAVPGFSAEGEKHLAGINIDIGCEFYQGPEDFAPITADDLTEVGVTFPGFPGLGADIPTDQ
ncbi:ATP-binding protein [Flavisphingomonas formosensis]|uniref:ATP-binding protein n=1 Tax=Flavisphingomonas formosensis TaxID=861534 RepID=UPI0012FCB0BB|nr:ATP-binding protein [Sphingomonas formosensis]